MLPPVALFVSRADSILFDFRVQITLPDENVQSCAAAAAGVK